MEVENRFNLLDEPWIPVVDYGLVSLMDIFTEERFKRLGGTPLEKAALLKLLLAITQSACTPKDEMEWSQVGASGVSEKSRAYLSERRDLFFLYGEKPFLQMQELRTVVVQSFYGLMPEISSGNTSVLTELQHERKMLDSDIALLLVVQMGFSFGGKKVDNALTLSPGYTSKTKNGSGKKSSPFGPSLGFMGMLHNFILGSSLLETLWLNLLSKEDIANSVSGVDAVGISPIDLMPSGEDDEVARNLKNSLMGRLLPLSRFSLIDDEGFHHTEGIMHPGYAEGVCDPSVAVNFSGKKPKVIWCDPEKQPWRQLTSLLGFMSQTTSNQFDCAYLKVGFSRARRNVDKFGILSIGVKVSSNTGEQYIGGSDDYVESEIILNSSIVGTIWYAALTLEMTDLEKLSKQLYGSTFSYFKKLSAGVEKDKAALATNIFWQQCAKHFGQLVETCIDEDKMVDIRRLFGRVALKSFDDLCPKNTARQIDAWASSRPNISKYIKNGR